MFWIFIMKILFFSMNFFLFLSFFEKEKKNYFKTNNQKCFWVSKIKTSLLDKLSPISKI